MSTTSVIGVKFTNATKTNMIESLSLAFEKNEIEIVNDPVLIAELQAFEMERLPSGLMRYGSPEGMHDDTVMALALAWQGMANQRPSAADFLDLGRVEFTSPYKW